jgi:1,4-dihydroxy-2-naphthoate octaprenyltransferase
VAGVESKELWQAALVVALLLAAMVVILSIWPITSVYATLSLVIVFYTILNVALEMRENLSAMVWFEHAVLILLVLIILFTNAQLGDKWYVCIEGG